MPDFCDECGSILLPDEEVWVCPECGAEEPRETSREIREEKQKIGDTNTSPSEATELEQLPTTDSGTIRKKDAMSWLHNRQPPSDAELRDAITPKPATHTGSAYPTEISNIRVTGSPEFIETIAGLFKPIEELEKLHTRAEINLQQIEKRDTDKLTDNYALYLSVAERG